jgi:guanylate kinase
MKRGRIFVISAPSGTGKSTVVAAVRKRYPELGFSVSYTTRPMRVGETDGVDYHFVDRATFQEMASGSKFAEWAEVHGNYYGTLKAQLEESMKDGRDLILDIDVQGGIAIKSAIDEAITIFLLPPSMEALRERLSGRATDSPEQIELRLANAKEELVYQDRYDHKIVNDDIERAAGELSDLIACGS